MGEVRVAQLARQDLVGGLVPAVGGAAALQGAGEAVHAQLGERPHVGHLLRHGGSVGLQVLPRQCVGEGAGPGGAQLGGGGDQRVAHDALEVPQCLVPVEEDGVHHGATRTTLPNLAPAPKRS